MPVGRIGASHGKREGHVKEFGSILWVNRVMDRTEYKQESNVPRLEFQNDSSGSTVEDNL